MPAPQPQTHSTSSRHLARTRCFVRTQRHALAERLLLHPAYGHDRQKLGVLDTWTHDVAMHAQHALPRLIRQVRSLGSGLGCVVALGVASVCVVALGYCMALEGGWVALYVHWSVGRHRRAQADGTTRTEADCSHFCLDSDATRHWVAAFLKFVV